MAKIEPHSFCFTIPCRLLISLCWDYTTSIGKKEARDEQSSSSGLRLYYFLLIAVVKRPTRIKIVIKLPTFISESGESNHFLKSAPIGPKDIEADTILALNPFSKKNMTNPPIITKTEARIILETPFRRTSLIIMNWDMYTKWVIFCQSRLQQKAPSFLRGFLL